MCFLLHVRSETLATCCGSIRPGLGEALVRLDVSKRHVSPNLRCPASQSRLLGSFATLAVRLPAHLGLARWRSAQHPPPSTATTAIILSVLGGLERQWPRVVEAVVALSSFCFAALPVRQLLALPSGALEARTGLRSARRKTPAPGLLRRRPRARRSRRGRRRASPSWSTTRPCGAGSARAQTVRGDGSGGGSTRDGARQDPEPETDRATDIAGIQGNVLSSPAFLNMWGTPGMSSRIPKG